MSDEIADFLDDTADVIETHGWIQGSYGDPARGFCAVGATKVVALQERWDGNMVCLVDAIGALANRVSPLVTKVLLEKDASPSPVVIWNDHVASGQQEVLDMIRSVAKEQRDE